MPKPEGEQRWRGYNGRMDHGDPDVPATGSEMTESASPPASPAPLPPAPLPRAATTREAGHGPGHPSDKVGPTRLSGAWTAAVVAIVLVVAMLIFILQNGREVPISFVSAHGHLPLGVAMLFSAVIGAVIVVGCGTARILQLRRMARRRARAVPRPVEAPVSPPD